MTNFETVDNKGYPLVVGVLGDYYSVVVKPIEECGTCEPHLRTITLDSSLKPHVLAETFYHELVHAILAQSGVAEILDEKQEEAVAQAVGAGMAQFLRNNGAVGV